MGQIVYNSDKNNRLSAAAYAAATARAIMPQLIQQQQMQQHHAPPGHQIPVGYPPPAIHGQIPRMQIPTAPHMQMLPRPPPFFPGGRAPGGYPPPGINSQYSPQMQIATPGMSIRAPYPMPPGAHPLLPMTAGHMVGTVIPTAAPPHISAFPPQPSAIHPAAVSSAGTTAGIVTRSLLL